jgi:hypothetical protein
MNILVREFEEADRASLRQLYVASRRAAFTWIAAESHQALDFDAHTQGEVILVAVANAQTVGFASIWKPDSFVHNLFANAQVHEGKRQCHAVLHSPGMDGPAREPRARRPILAHASAPRLTHRRPP